MQCLQYTGHWLEVGHTNRPCLKPTGHWLEVGNTHRSCLKTTGHRLEVWHTQAMPETHTSLTGDVTHTGYASNPQATDWRLDTHRPCFKRTGHWHLKELNRKIKILSHRNKADKLQTWWLQFVFDYISAIRESSLNCTGAVSDLISVVSQGSSVCTTPTEWGTRSPQHSTLPGYRPASHNGANSEKAWPILLILCTKNMQINNCYRVEFI